MKKRIIAILLMCVLVLVSGCGIKGKNTSSKNDEMPKTSDDSTHDEQKELTPAQMVKAGTFPNLVRLIQTDAIEASNSNYSYEIIDKSQKFEGTASTIGVDYHYTYVVLTGKTDAINKINKELKSMAEKKMAKESDAFEYAKMDSDTYSSDELYYDELTDVTEQYITYMSKDYVSISVTNDWYGGGAHGDTYTSGVTFNLSTGELVDDITVFTGGKSIDDIHAELKNYLVENGADNNSPDEINNISKTAFNFYIDKDGKIIICFDPFTYFSASSGGWTYTLEGDESLAKKSLSTDPEEYLIKGDLYGAEIIPVSVYESLSEGDTWKGVFHTYTVGKAQEYEDDGGIAFCCPIKDENGTEYYIYISINRDGEVYDKSAKYSNVDEFRNYINDGDAASGSAEPFYAILSEPMYYPESSGVSPHVQNWYPIEEGKTYTVNADALLSDLYGNHTQTSALSEAYRNDERFGFGSFSLKNGNTEDYIDDPFHFKWICNFDSSGHINAMTSDDM
ncbi:MAG: DUF4163 domain-containing protein [Lachnospiraceae bacterium]|nr:DUF4163 domain-containing protein [Lachnospiraceae bacterium]